MCKKLTSVPKTELFFAFSYVIDKLENDRQTGEHLGSIISRNVIIGVIRTSQCRTDWMPSMKLQISLHNYKTSDRVWRTPKTVCQYRPFLIVPEREDESSPKIRTIGLSTLSCGCIRGYGRGRRWWLQKRKNLFNKPRMIPRWKCELYEPKTCMLEWIVYFWS